MTTTCATPRADGPDARTPRRAVALSMLIACCGLLLCTRQAAAQQAAAQQATAQQAATQKAPTYHAVGIWPDIALSLGGGIGIAHPIATNVYGGLRVGALFAFEPWVINLGLSGELGGLPRRGLGAELELNYVRGPYLQVGYDRISGGDWMARFTAGFALFGVQWQHRMSSTTPNNALLFLLRLPLGIGWFFLHDQERRQREPPPPRKVSEAGDG